MVSGFLGALSCASWNGDSFFQGVWAAGLNPTRFFKAMKQ